jgi:purine-binding chemotaxis protein CheW
MPEAQKYLTFAAGGRNYALPAGEILEIIAMPAVARLPVSPPALLGMANLRGTAVPVASLRHMLGQKAGAAAPRAIVLDGPSPVVLVIDSVTALLSLEAGTIETQAARMAALPGEVLRGAFSSGAGATKILDVQAMLAQAFAQRRQAAAGGLPRRAGAAAAPAVKPELFVSFAVADQIFALAVGDVQEIMSLPPGIARIAQADAVNLGVIAFRDTLLPLLSLRGLLGFAPDGGAPDGGAPGGGDSWRQKIIVTHVAGMQLGLLADRMGAVVPAAAEEIQPMPGILSARTGGESRIRGLLRHAGGLISILAPDRLLGAEIMARFDNTVPPARAAGERRVKTVQFVVFRLGDEEFGLPVDAVDEVARLPETLTRLPKAPKFLSGVINLRGDILPVIDQRKRFGMAPYGGPAGRQRLLVLRGGKHRAGLVVDAISQVLTVPEDLVAEAPDMAGEAARLVLGVINLPETQRMILLLDPAQLLTRAERALLETFAVSPGAKAS